MRLTKFIGVASLAYLALPVANAFAYIGPGAGLSALGSLLSLVSAIGLAIVGFVWYPVKRLLRGRKSKGSATGK